MFKPETIREALLLILSQPEEAKQEFARIDDGESTFTLNSPLVVEEGNFGLDILKLGYVGPSHEGSIYRVHIVTLMRPILITVPPGKRIKWIQAGATKSSLRELWREGIGMPNLLPGAIFAICLEGKSSISESPPSISVSVVKPINITG